MIESSRKAGLVTTIIPVYNRPELIVEAVNSVLSQTYQAIEIIDGAVTFLPQGTLLLLSLLFLVRGTINLAIHTCNVTNEMKFYVRSIIASVLSYAALIFYPDQTLLSMILFSNVFYILVFELFPYREYKRLTTTYLEYYVWKSACFFSISTESWVYNDSVYYLQFRES